MTPLIFRATDNAPIPFPMPEPQRGLALQVLISEAGKANVPPAMLVTHLPYGENLKYKPIREVVLLCMMAEVPGMKVCLLARAFRRDKHWVREAVKLKNVKEHATLSAGAGVETGGEVGITEEHENRAADRGCGVSTCCASSLLGEDSDPCGDILGNLERPASPESVVSIDQLESPIAVTESCDESGKLSRALDEFACYPTTLAAAANIPADIRARSTEEMHRHIHDKFDALGNDPHSILIKSALRPGDICPFCERHIQEHPGPIMHVDRIVGGHERPTLSCDQSPKPLVEDFGGHEGEHGSCSISGGHESSIILHNVKESAPARKEGE